MLPEIQRGMKYYNHTSLTHARYMELVFYVKRYYELSHAQKKEITAIMENCAGKRYAKLIIRAIIKNIPYKSLDIPFSERSYRRIRADFFNELNEKRPL